MNNRFFTEDHEWVEVNGNIATIGITAYAAEELGEVVFVDLPSVGFLCEKGSEFGSVESVKTVSSLYSPIDGEVIEVNPTLESCPEKINNSPENEGWLIKLSFEKLPDVDDLMNEDEYRSTY